MKIAIIACENTNGTCSTMGCFKAYNNRNKAFSIYEKDEDLVPVPPTWQVASDN